MPAGSQAVLASSETELERVDRDGDLCVRCIPTGKMWFLSGGSNENEGGEAHAQLLRDAYDPAREIGLRLTIPNQDGTDLPDARAEPESAELCSARSDPTLEPAEVAALVEKFREENELLDWLTDAGTVDVEAEHSTGDTAPAATLEHIARSLKDGRRILLFARPDTAEWIVHRIDKEPRCMWSSAARMACIASITRTPGRTDGERHRRRVRHHGHR